MIATHWTRVEGVEIPPSSNFARLEFVTPLRIGPKDALGTRFFDVVVNLAQQLAALSPWTGVGFTPRLGYWRDLAKATRIETEGLYPLIWDGFSSVNGREAAAGYLGRLRVAAPPPDLWARLCLGEVLHAGRAAAKGYGRYRLSGEAA